MSEATPRLVRDADVAEGTLVGARAPQGAGAAIEGAGEDDGPFEANSELARFLAWWRDECALKIHAFGVTRPNERMQRLLRATGCVEMNRRFGFEEATELFHARA